MLRFCMVQDAPAPGNSGMKFELRTATNGAILRIETDDEPPALQEIVYQCPDADDEGAEVEAFADFLRQIVECCGPQMSRYSRKRIYIRVEPGDKWEEPVEDEETDIAETDS